MFSACCRGRLYCRSGNCRVGSWGWRAGHGMNKTQLSPLAKLHYPRGCAVRELNVVFSWGCMGWRLLMVSVWLILEGWEEISHAKKSKEIPERWGWTEQGSGEIEFLRNHCISQEAEAKKGQWTDTPTTLGFGQYPWPQLDIRAFSKAIASQQSCYCRVIPNRELSAAPLAMTTRPSDPQGLREPNQVFIITVMSHYSKSQMMKLSKRKGKVGQWASQARHEAAKA